jgi:hypothetical protein
MRLNLDPSRRLDPNGLRAEAGCQRKQTMPLGVSSSERPNGEQIKRFRPLHRPNRAKQNRNFHQTPRTFDDSPVRRYSSRQKKGVSKFPVRYVYLTHQKQRDYDQGRDSNRSRQD